MQLGILNLLKSFLNIFRLCFPVISHLFIWKRNEEEKDILHDERQRDRFLVKMMYILMVKRLESSWFSFYSTVEKIKDHHQNALDKIKAYQEDKIRYISMKMMKLTCLKMMILKMIMKNLLSEKKKSQSF